MDNEVPLPPPRRIRHRSPAQAAGPSSNAAPSFRKARRLSRFDDCSSQPSSDPALFSSDDIPASGLENYHAPVSGAGRKRRYRGTWWGEQVIDPKRKRADFKEKRHVDSGVWMGSDESAAESLLSSDSSSWGEDLLKNVLDPRMNGKPLHGSSQSAAPGALSVLPVPISKGRQESEEHGYARAVVNDCLEKGEDSIDLGNLNLEKIPSGLLQPLQHLTKQPAVPEPPLSALSENAFSSLQPFLRVYLPGNSLSSLPNELFDLKDLKVLSVRNNKLHELPPTVSKLKALEVLNISVNRLTFLPWELLSLLQDGELKHFTAYPNSFQPIEDASIATWHRQISQEGKTDSRDPLKFDVYEGSPPDDAWTAIHVATGPLTRLDTEGKVVNKDPEAHKMVIKSDSAPASDAPSLRELALRSICKLPGIDQATDDELLEFPALVVPLLSRARDIRAAGGQHCSVCQREYVVPRTMWHEWWDCTPHENGMKRPRVSGEKLRPLPFQRFGCSLACSPGSSE
ncbi:Leucine-rich repeat typical subtype [Penicillium capsulatum]|uniref:Leucine-rich repeat typical subtype n=1 Tax=Penicillium capsulatum TaxID=69766 RepID=A0A9W9HSY4_9EURO|nr:Leucine-rich repeat typical subtype [Penicillium capsulatum]KAJ6106268.1 Leucine-rich repeat typical subtype [Penicillium capsulatum]